MENKHSDKIEPKHDSFGSDTSKNTNNNNTNNENDNTLNRAFFKLFKMCQISEKTVNFLLVIITIAHIPSIISFMGKDYNATKRLILSNAFIILTLIFIYAFFYRFSNFTCFFLLLKSLFLVASWHYNQSFE